MRADCGNLLGTTYSVLGTGYSVFSFPRRICLHGNRDYLYFFSFIIMDNKEKIYPPNFKSFPLLPLGFSCGSAGKESACNVGDLDSIPGLGRSPGEGNGYTSQEPKGGKPAPARQVLFIFPHCCHKTLFVKPQAQPRHTQSTREKHNMSQGASSPAPPPP